jgi:hypothetical protein
MARVPGFKYDVFVSYAQVNNEPVPGIEGSCWVSNLVALLRTLVDERLGRRGETKIWIDEQRLEGNSSVTPEIQEAVASSATLLVVLSNGYLASQWCRQEWECFVKAAGSTKNLAGRLFIVLPDELPLERWPKAFQDRLGYKFYSRTDQSDIIQLGKPKPMAEQGEYYRQLDKLRRQLAEQLQKGVEPPPPGPPSKIVYVAEVSSDLEDMRDQLVESLKNAKYSILPDRFYSRDPEQYRAEVGPDLLKCVLYVQMLGPRAIRADDTQTYEGLQAEQARATLKDSRKTIFWRSPDTEPSKAKNADHRALLENPLMMVTDFEEFKQTVLTSLRRLGDDDEDEPSDDNRMLLVNTVQEDKDLAEQLLDDVEKRKLDYRIIYEDKSLIDAAKEKKVVGLMVVYGRSHDDWVNDQVFKMRSLVLEKKAAAPKCAVYISPPENRRLLCYFRQLVRIDSKQAFEQYLSAVAGGKRE